MSEDKKVIELTNEYAGKGSKWVNEEYDNVKSKIQTFVDAIDKKGAITETGDPDFGENPSDALAKSVEFQVKLSALRNVKQGLDRAAKFKELAEKRSEDGDLLTPAASPLEEELLNTLKSVKSTKNYSFSDSLKEAVDEGRLDLNHNRDQKGSSCYIGKNDDEGYKILQNVLTHDGANNYPSEYLRDGRIVLDPIIRQDLLSVIPTVQIGVGGWKFMVQKLLTSAVSGQAEGAEYNEQNTEFLERTIALKNAGVWMALTDQISNDEPFLMNIVSDQLSQLLRKYVGTQIVSGTGAAQQFNGLETYSVAAQFANSRPVGFDTASRGRESEGLGGDANRGQIPVYNAATGANNTADATATIVHVFNAATNIEDKGGETPDYVVAKSGTIAKILTAQDSNNNFIFPQNAFSVGVFPMLGIPVVKESNIEDNRILVGAFRNQTRLGIAGGLTTAVGYKDQDFTRFQRTIRTGFRGNLGIYETKAFVWVDKVVA